MNKKPETFIKAGKQIFLGLTVTFLYLSIIISLKQIIPFVLLKYSALGLGIAVALIIIRLEFSKRNRWRV